MTTPLAIEATGLVKRFGDKAALDGVDISVPTGTVTAVLGPNGAGKTTAVRILTTLSDATAGTATVAGFDVATQANEVRRRIGLAAQDATIDPLLTGRENLVMIGELHQLARGRGQGPRRRAARAVQPHRRRRPGHLAATPAACGAGSTSPPRWSPARRSCSSTSPPPASTPGPATSCGRCSTPSSGRAPPCCSPPSTSRRPTASPTTSWSSTTARSSPSGDARSLKRQVGGDNIGVTVVDPAGPRRRRPSCCAAAPAASPWSTARSAPSPPPPRPASPAWPRSPTRWPTPGIEVEDLSLRQPTLDEVFLTLTGVAIARRRRARGGSRMTAPTDTLDLSADAPESIADGRHAGGGPRAAPAARHLPRRVGGRPAGPHPHEAPARGPQRRHHPADHVRGAVRLRVRRRHRRAGRRQLPRVPDGRDHGPDARVHRLRRGHEHRQRPQEPGGRPLPLAAHRQGRRARRPRGGQRHQVVAARS